MSSPAQTAANRGNAQMSTGPRSQAGKSRASRNAFRHGLAVDVHLDAAITPEVEKLARALAGAQTEDSAVRRAAELAAASGARCGEDSEHPFRLIAEVGNRT